ncbi:MAG: hypothetical protein ABEJ96_09650, partial [Thiohalorhabdaceae bacterium]
MEFAYLDFLLSEQANIRAGLTLTPLGMINQTHEPNTFFGNKRPIVETTVLPTTMRENGVGVYGQFAGGSLEYSAYIQNSWDATGLSGEGLGHVKQEGAALANDLALTGDLEWHPAPGATVGVSAWHGNMGQGQSFDGQKPDVPMTLWDVHAEYKAGPVWLRALYSQATIDDTLAVNRGLATDDSGNPVSDEAIPEKMTGWYVEAGYDIMPMLGGPGEQKLYPWVRYSSLDTQASLASDVKSAGFTADPANDRAVTAVGLHYMPHPQVAVKA